MLLLKKLAFKLKMKNIIIGILSVLLIISVGFNLNFLVSKQVSKLRSPVVMVPGSSASWDRYDTMIKKINQSSGHKHSVLKLKVMNDGSINEKGSVNQHDREPFIVIGFENNHDGYENIQKQTRMLDKALRLAQRTYHFHSMKFLGHSNGGLVITLWLEKYYENFDESYDVDVERLMMIASPFNLDHKDGDSPMLKYMIDHRQSLPSSMTVYLIEGASSYDEDGIVNIHSESRAKYIFQKQVKHYTVLMLTGKDAEHSSLPQNPQVVHFVQKNLLDSVKTTPNVDTQKTDDSSDSSDN